MKHIIILLLGVLLISSCDMSKKEIENSRKFTTVELQEANKDTIIVSLINNEDLYVFDDNVLVIDKYKIETIDGILIPAGLLFVLIIMSVILIVVIVVTLNE